MLWEARMGGLTAIRVGVAVLVAAAAGCTNRVGPGAPPPVGAGAGGTTVGSKGGAGTATDAGGGCKGPPAPNCGLMTFIYESPIPADVLIVLDKSSSMNEKWASVTA